LACLGLAGIFWLGRLSILHVRHFLTVRLTLPAVLGAYLTTSASQSADVECFASASSTQPLNDAIASCELLIGHQLHVFAKLMLETVHTDQYQAMLPGADVIFIDQRSAWYVHIPAFGPQPHVIPSSAVLHHTLDFGNPRHSKGDEHMWHGPVTSCAWFNSYGNGVKRNNSGGSSILPITSGQRKYTGENAKPIRKR